MSASRAIVGSATELQAQGIVEIVVPDLSASRDFCCGLGFKLVRETLAFVVLEWDGALLFLAQNAAAPVAPRWVSIRIIVPDVEAVWTQVNSADLPIGSAIDDRPYGLRDFTVQAPGGFDVRFAQVIA